MLHFKDPITGEVFAYETVAQRAQWGAPGLEPMSDEEVDAHRNRPPTAQQLADAFTVAIQERLDDFARTRGYDSILSATTYATSAVPAFAADGQRAVELRDSTWVAAYELMAEVQSGVRPIPASLGDIEAHLPALEWR